MFIYFWHMTSLLASTFTSATCICRFIEQFPKSSFFRAEADGGGGLVFAADSTPNLFQLYKNQASML